MLTSRDIEGSWNRLHRAESEVLAALLTAAEADAVRRRLGLPDDADERASWIPPAAGHDGGRFLAPHGPGALYLGESLATCMAEAAHHHGRHCAASLGTPPGTRAVFRHLVFRVTGRFADASRDRRLGLHLPDDLAPSWAFGNHARALGLAGVHYRSVRRRGGRCLAVFDGRKVVLLRAELGAVVLEWDGAVSRRIA